MYSFRYIMIILVGTIPGHTQTDTHIHSYMNHDVCALCAHLNGCFVQHQNDPIHCKGSRNKSNNNFALYAETLGISMNIMFGVCGVEGWVRVWMCVSVFMCCET